MARDEIWDILKANGKRAHQERVAKTPSRIEYAIRQFKNNDIEHLLINNQTGHFHCKRKRDGKLFQFYASTGKIQGYDNIRGIHSLIWILLK